MFHNTSWDLPAEGMIFILSVISVGVTEDSSLFSLSSDVEARNSSVTTTALPSMSFAHVSKETNVFTAGEKLMNNHLKHNI